MPDGWAPLDRAWLVEPDFLQSDLRPDYLVGASGALRHASAPPKLGNKLAESEARFRYLADNIPQLAWMARPDGHIFWYNRRWFEYTGARPEEMEGWGWEKVHDPEALPGVIESWKHALATKKPWEHTFPLRGADGAYRLVPFPRHAALR